MKRAKKSKNHKRVKDRKFIFHPSFLCFLVYSFLCGNLYFFLLYTFSIILHEFAHIWVAKKLGYRLEYFKLGVTGASMKLEEDIFYLTDELWVTLAGPCLNLAIFVVTAVFWWLCPISYNYTVDFGMVNLMIFLFNMLPIFSLDGGRIFVCILERKIERLKAIKVVRVIGICFAIVMFMVFAISLLFGVLNFSLGVMAIFLFASSTDGNGANYFKVGGVSKLEKLSSCHGLSQRVLYFSEHARLIDLYRRLTPNTLTLFVIHSCLKDKCVTIPEDRLTDMIQKYGATKRVCDVI